ncbi:MAG TPA: class I SAM-dependent methyltransferase, partial [Chitinophagaceae bacterium]
MKDRFSIQSRAYAVYRPHFPEELYRFILQYVVSFDLAWDAGTGNGQTAIRLSDHFKKVVATDTSESQLAAAFHKPNIEYRKEAAEHSSIPDHAVNLVTVSQAIHWFDFEKFYNEVRRVAAEDAIIAVFCYSNIRSSHGVVDRLLSGFYQSTAAYWDYERRYVDAGYRDIPFPFAEIKAPVFRISCSWTLQQLTGYIETWSASQHYRREHGRSIIPS